MEAPPKLHACSFPDCGKTFAKKSNLVAHGRVHTGAMPFTCDHCSRAFKWLSSLKAHLSVCPKDKPEERMDETPPSLSQHSAQSSRDSSIVTAIPAQSPHTIYQLPYITQAPGVQHEQVCQQPGHPHPPVMNQTHVQGPLPTLPSISHDHIIYSQSGRPPSLGPSKHLPLPSIKPLTSLAQFSGPPPHATGDQRSPTKRQSIENADTPIRGGIQTGVLMSVSPVNSASNIQGPSGLHHNVYGLESSTPATNWNANIDLMRSTEQRPGYARTGIPQPTEDRVGWGPMDVTDSEPASTLMMLSEGEPQTSQQ